MRRAATSSAVLLPVLLACLAGPSVSSERRIPLDVDLGVTEIDAALERRLNLFPEIPDLREVRAFETGDGRLVLEITRYANGKILRDRREITETDLKDLRRRVTEALERTRGVDLVDPEEEGRGRRILVHGVTGLALGYWGWAIPVSLDVREPSSLTGSLPHHRRRRLLRDPGRDT